MDYPLNMVVGVDAMEAAIQFCWWCCTELIDVFTVLPSTEGNLILRVLQALKMHHEDGVSRRDLLRQVHVSGRQLTVAIDALREREEVTTCTVDGRVHYAYKPSRHP